MANNNSITEAVNRLSQLSTRSAASQGHGLFSRPEVNGLYYNNKAITLDGYKFIGCRFDNCILSISSTNFDIINCIIDPSTTIKYGAEVIKVLQLFNSRLSWAAEVYPEFSPIENSDGTITIASGVL